MITFWAPAARCLRASAALVNRPVDSITTSTPRSPQGSAGGIALGQHLDLPGRRPGSRRRRPRRPRSSVPSSGVVLEQVRQRGDIAQVVGRDDLDAGRGACAGVHRTPEVPPDPAEPVDAHPDSHCTLSFGC